jgi:hypothetical protein
MKGFTKMECVLVPQIRIYDYVEVFYVTYNKDGTIQKSTTTGKYIHKEDQDKLPKKHFTTAVPSTRISSNPDGAALELFFEWGDTDKPEPCQEWKRHFDYAMKKRE